MKIWMFVTLFLSVFCYSQADTKILREVNILSDNASRKETFSLKNEKSPTAELIIEGNVSQDIYPKDNPDFVYRIDTIYVADKDGYRVKYELRLEPYIQIQFQLNPLTLKSLSG